MSLEFEEREKKIKKLRLWQKENDISSIIKAVNDSDPIIRAEAIMLLGNLKLEYIVSPVITALEDPDEHVRYCAIEALSKIGADSASEYIINAAKNSSEFVRCHALKVLSRMHNSESLKFLLQNLINPTRNISLEAAIALENMLDYPPCEEKLTEFFENNKAMQDSHPELYEMIVLRNKIKHLF
jgi:HEAT repeat protein